MYSIDDASVFNDTGILSQFDDPRPRILAGSVIVFPLLHPPSTMPSPLCSVLL